MMSVTETIDPVESSARVYMRERIAKGDYWGSPHIQKLFASEARRMFLYKVNDARTRHVMAVFGRQFFDLWISLGGLVADSADDEEWIKRDPASTRPVDR